MSLFKIGHFTMDNASNNKTMMESLQAMLAPHDVVFDPDDRRIMCFAHIIDLCSKRVVLATSNGADNLDENGYSSLEDNATAPSDPISRARAAVQAIRGSGLRRDAFNEAITTGNTKGYFKAGQSAKPVVVKQLQLLRDVRTRWDSVYHMLRRLRELRPVCPYTSSDAKPAK